MRRRSVDAPSRLSSELIDKEAKGLLVIEAVSTLASGGVAMSPDFGNLNAKRRSSGHTAEKQITGLLPVHNAQSPASLEPSVGKHNPFTRLCNRARGSLQVYTRNVRKEPLLLLLPPLLVSVVCMSLGVYGVVAGARKEAADKRSVVYGAGLDWAASFQLSFEQFFTPLVTLSIFIKRNPYFPSFALEFQTIASDVVATLPNNTVQEIQVSPLGVIATVWPPTSQQAVSPIGLDIFAAPALRGGGLDTVASRKLLLNGPFQLLRSSYGAVVRLPIFIQNSTLNETFGTNKSSAWLGQVLSPDRRPLPPLYCIC
ncbi:hypothetical protein V8C86DRAFT_1096537 [Haematococcus lacustris]